MKEHVIYLDSGDDIPSTVDKLSWVKSARVLLVWPDRGSPLQTRYELVRIARYAQQRGIRIGLVSFHPEVRANARDLGIPLFSSLEHLPADRWEQQGVPVINQQSFVRNIQTEEENVDQEKDNPETISDGEVEPSKEVNNPTPLPGNITSAYPDQNPQESAYEKIDHEAWARHAAEDSDTSQSESQRHSSITARVLSVLLSLCSLLALLAVVVPSARISLIPDVSSGEIAVPVNLDASGEILVPGNIPVEERIESFTISRYFLTTGRAEVGSAFAQGYVVFENPGTDVVNVPSGSGLRTEWGTRFETLSTVRVQPGEVSEEVLVRAVEAGEGGNVDAGEIRGLDGSLGLILMVNNPEAASGGENKQVYAVSSFDQRSSGRKMLEAIERDLEMQAVQLLNESELLLPGSVEILDIHEGEMREQVGDAAEGFFLSWTAQIRMVVVNKNLLNQASAGVLADEMSEAKFLIQNSIDTAVEPSSSSESGTWDLVVRYQSADKLDFQAVSAWLAGKPIRRTVTEMNERYSLAVSPSICSNPSWMPVFPFVPSRIQVFWAWEGES